MNPLEQSLQQFARAVEAKPNSLAEIVIENGLDAEQRVQIYRNNYVISLTDSLKGAYPVVLALVGQDFFEQLSKAFLKQHPLLEGNLQLFGQFLPGFIRNVSQTDALPYLADVADLEWLYLRHLSQVPDNYEFPFSELADVSQEQIGRVCFRLNGDVSLFSSEYPVVSIYQGVMLEHLDDINLHEPEFTMVRTSGIGEAVIQKLTKQQHQFLSACDAGVPLADAPVYEELEQDIQRFIGQQVLIGFTLAEFEEVITND